MGVGDLKFYLGFPTLRGEGDPIFFSEINKGLLTFVTIPGGTRRKTENRANSVQLQLPTGTELGNDNNLVPCCANQKKILKLQ